LVNTVSLRTDRRELPPTAGLPLRAGDLLPWRSQALNTTLAALLGREDTQLTCSGTAALVIALSTLRRYSRRREVIVPAWTCPLVPIAIAHCGLKLRLCDLRPGHFDMDPQMLARLCGSGTLAILPTHIGGRLADVAAARTCAASCGAWVIEDSAQALGARHADDIPAGMLGDIGVFSLAAGKGLSIYEGGLLTTRHDDLREALRATARILLPRHLGWELRRCAELLGYAVLYGPQGLRFAYGYPLRRALRRGDPIGAVGDRFPLRIPLHRVGAWRQTVGARASARLPEFLHTLHAQAQPRLRRLRAIHGLKVIDDVGSACGTWPFLLLLMPDRACRDAALERLWNSGRGVSRLFVHALPDYDYLHGIVAAAEVPRARDFAARSLTIGNSLWLDEATFIQVADTLEAICRARQS
jgi:dTDP-4-amino-4,6-dideoxygalactose transaminase